MSDVHAGPGLVPHTGRCLWHSNYEDVYLSCDDTSLPGEVECATHFIASAHRRDDLERAAILGAYPRLRVA